MFSTKEKNVNLGFLMLFLSLHFVLLLLEKVRKPSARKKKIIRKCCFIKRTKYIYVFVFPKTTNRNLNLN